MNSIKKLTYDLNTSTNRHSLHFHTPHQTFFEYQTHHGFLHDAQQSFSTYGINSQGYKYFIPNSSVMPRNDFNSAINYQQDSGYNQFYDRSSIYSFVYQPINNPCSSQTYQNRSFDPKPQENDQSKNQCFLPDTYQTEKKSTTLLNIQNRLSMSNQRISQLNERFISGLNLKKLTRKFSSRTNKFLENLKSKKLKLSR